MCSLLELRGKPFGTNAFISIMEMNEEEKGGEAATNVFICRNKIGLALISRTPTDLSGNSWLTYIAHAGLSERALYKHTNKRYNDNMSHPC